MLNDEGKLVELKDLEEEEKDSFLNGQELEEAPDLEEIASEPDSDYEEDSEFEDDMDEEFEDEFEDDFKEDEE